MTHHPKSSFSPLCDLHHCPMRRVMLEESAPETGSFHACERRDCHRIFRDDSGYADFAEGHFDTSRVSARACPVCGATLYLVEVDHAQKIETWECAERECSYSEDAHSPSSR